MRFNFNVKTKIKNSKISKKIISLANSNIIIKIIVGAIIYGIAFIPVYLFIAVWYLAGPTGFWEKFAIIAIGCFFGGGLEIFLLVAATVLFLAVVCDEI